MRTRKLKLEKRLRIIKAPGGKKEYEGKVFVYELSPSTQEPLIIDWLGGLQENKYRMSLGHGWVLEYLEEAYSTGGRWSREYYTVNKDIVGTFLIHGLLTQQGELGMVDPSLKDFGAPVWFKRKKNEVDLLLQSVIMNTLGVTNILTFHSEVNADNEYICKVEIEAGKDIIWQTIEI